MSSIKSVIVLFFLLLSISIYAQIKNIPLTKNAAFSFYTPNTKTINYTIDFKNINFQKSKPIISLYNKTTSLYDTYYIGNRNDYVYPYSNVLFKNKSNFLIDLFLGNDSFTQNNYLMLNNNSTYRVRDSFNPYGSSTIGEALLGGFLSLLSN